VTCSETLSPLVSLEMGGDDALTWVTRAAVDALPGVDFASISLFSGDALITVGSTDPLALKADSLQYELGEGPCVDAARASAVVESADVHGDSRWPLYGARAGELWVRGQTALAVQASGSTLGALNLYSTRPGLLDRTAVARARGYAVQAAKGMLMQRQVATLSDALQSRRTIGQAIGLVMERYGLDEDRAFQYLVRVSQTSNVKLRQIARELVEQSNASP
jgi:ANTAR domain